jgi:hypothetical protein
MQPFMCYAAAAGSQIDIDVKGTGIALLLFAGIH